MQMKENEKKINDAFSDLDSLRHNTQDMVETCFLIYSLFLILPSHHNNNIRSP